MTAKAIMLFGTGSDVGKSLIAAGLARAFTGRGLKVMPFKPQNMSNNAAVTEDGGEIGRAQALQARAARQATTVHMNPILLKPESATGAQVIVQGKRTATMKARAFFEQRQRYMPAIIESFGIIRESADLVIVEGAGSPAEVNLRDGDLANMGFAQAADVDGILVADIHRGGVIASIVGTLEVMEGDDRARIKGFIINKFHGDISLFDEGRTYLETKTGLPCLGVVPHFAPANRFPAEDAVALEHRSVNNHGQTKIAVLRLPRIANFDDLDPLAMEPDVCLQFVNHGEPVPGDAELVIIPGSKSTIADLAYVCEQGWDIDLAAHIRRGGHVLGLCGGYQMLGEAISDPDGLEGPAGDVEGLGFLDVETVLLTDKTLTSVAAKHAESGLPLQGYEIHLGTTKGPDCDRPFAHIGAQRDGAQSRNGRVIGTYIHGCLASDAFRTFFLQQIGGKPGAFSFEETIDATLDELAQHLERHVDLDRLLALASGP
jgi:adenosylcobyric acid synthase